MDAGLIQDVIIAAVFLGLGMALDRWLTRGDRRRAAEDSKKLDVLVTWAEDEGFRVEDERDQSGRRIGVRITRLEGIPSVEQFGHPSISGTPSVDDSPA